MVLCCQRWPHDCWRDLLIPHKKERGVCMRLGCQSTIPKKKYRPSLVPLSFKNSKRKICSKSCRPHEYRFNFSTQKTWFSYSAPRKKSISAAWRNTNLFSLKKLVIYEMIEDTRPGRTYGPGSIWARPLTMFKENVEWEGKTVKRFTCIKDE